MGDQGVADRKLALARSDEVWREAARKTLNAYADDDGLTMDECEHIMSPSLCVEVQEVLRRGAEGEVLPEERASLERKGFPRVFTDAIAGFDGRAALKRRARWLGEHAVTRWWRFDAAAAVRAERVAEIGRMGVAGAVAMSELIECIRDGDAAVREAALGAITKLGRAAYPELIGLLKSARATDRMMGSLLFENMGRDAAGALRYLIERFSDCDESVRILAVRAVGNLGTAGKEAAPALAGSVRNDRSELVRFWALKALESVDPLWEMRTPAFIDALADPCGDVASTARQELFMGVVHRRIDTSEVVARLVDGRPRVRLHCAQILGAIGPMEPDILPAVEYALEYEQDDEVRRALSSAYARMQFVSAKPELDLLLWKPIDDEGGCPVRMFLENTCIEP